jgi:hypothetical protein
MVAVLIACTTACLANTNGIKAEPMNIYQVTQLKALSIPGLPAGMKAQIDFGFLKIVQPVYTVEVKLNGDLYRIKSTCTQWLEFYKPAHWITADIKPELYRAKK